MCLGKDGDQARRVGHADVPTSRARALMCKAAGLAAWQRQSGPNAPIPCLSTAARPGEPENPRSTLQERHADEQRRLIPNMLFQSLGKADFLTAAPSSRTEALHE